MDWLSNIEFWHWWILAGVLLILELTTPMFLFLWLGIAAAATGFLLMVFPSIPIETQLVMFAVLSVVAVIAWRRYRETHLKKSDQPNLNRRGEQYVGRTFTLDGPIENGVGKVSVDDSTWRVRGPDMATGQKVRVVDVDGTVFVVEPASPGNAQAPPV